MNRILKQTLMSVAHPQHLRLCPDCVSFLNTYRKSVSVSRSIRPEEIPLRIRDNIFDFLRACVRKSGSNS
jgi:hypothetical protein